MDVGTHVAEAIARELRAGLARRRMTHADLARAAGVSPRMVNRVLRDGVRGLPIDEYVVLTAALHGNDPKDLARKLVSEVVRPSAAT